MEAERVVFVIAPNRFTFQTVDNVPQLVGLIFFVLPGYVGLWAHDLIVPAPDRTTFRATMWSLLLSAAGALVAAQLVPPAFLAHLFGSAPLSPTALVGTAAQTLASFAVGGGFGLLTRYVLKNRLGPRSAYPTAWDALWSEHGWERRAVVVTTPGGSYAGTLTYADDPRIGRALVLHNPAQWDPATGRYLPLGAAFTYFPADEIRRIDVTRIPKGENDERVQGQQRIGRQHPDDGARGGGVPAGSRAEGAARRVPRSQDAGGDDAGHLHQPDADRDPVGARPDAPRAG